MEELYLVVMLIFVLVVPPVVLWLLGKLRHKNDARR